jgi:WD40 repeat protein
VSGAILDHSPGVLMWPEKPAGISALGIPDPRCGNTSGLIRNTLAGNGIIQILALLLLTQTGSFANAQTVPRAVQNAASPLRWVVTASENKLDLKSGIPSPVPDPAPDTLTLLDYTRPPTRVYHLTNVANTVLGPPSSVAIHPEGQLGLIADSIRLDPEKPGRWFAQRRVHILALSRDHPRIIGEIQTGWQPSGISFSPSGRIALVANRAGGTISVLSVKPPRVQHVKEVRLGEPEDEVIDVAIHPRGRWAFAAIHQKGILQVLSIQNDPPPPLSPPIDSIQPEVSATDRKVSVFGRPQRILFTPDGELCLAVGTGWGNGADMDALTVIDTTGPTPQTLDYIPIGANPESIDISPDGQLCVAILRNGSDLAATDPFHQDHGLLMVLERHGQTFRRCQVLKTGRIPSGAVFTPDGRQLLIGCHVDKHLRIYQVRDQRIYDTGDIVDLPGHPAALRASP